MSKFSYQSFLESVQNLRKYLQEEPKFAEKGRELDSGGSLDPKLANMMVMILAEIEKKMPNIQVTITTGNDKFHQNLKVDSKHKIGKAIDFTISPYTASNGETIKKILDQFASTHKGFSYLDEYSKPSRYSTGGHFHVSYDPIKPEGSHARKDFTYYAPSSRMGSSDTRKLDVFDFGDIQSGAPSEAPIDTWAGFIQRLKK